MSKAFTKESDSEFESLPALPRRQLPAGVPNYITSGGAKRLRDELNELLERKRQQTDNPTAASQPIDARLTSRIRQLQEILQSVQVIEPPATGRSQIGFGATVNVRDLKSGEQETYRIVGLNEADPANDKISWLSPLAKHLQGQAPGNRIKFPTPIGERELEIVSVTYDT